MLSRLRQALEQAVAEQVLVSPTPSVVDLGCGDRPYQPIFAARGASYIGADLAPNRRADVFIDESGRTPLGDGCADIVLSTQVLEHVASPTQYLQECARLLQPAGVLLVTTHGYWAYHPSPSDLWRWTGEGLALLLRQSGFEVQKLTGILGTGAAALQLLQDATLPLLPRLARRLVTPVFQTGMWMLDRTSTAEQRVHDALVYLAVAIKK
ncbi:MAG: class I SAM-dependent methyltransferase [Deltaproteobacteria bacterium]|nr:class I SAM-dependent methyltransferase [Deltaproteobacteria bacterium]